MREVQQRKEKYQKKAPPQSPNAPLGLGIAGPLGSNLYHQLYSKTWRWFLTYARTTIEHYLMRPLSSLIELYRPHPTAKKGAIRVSTPLLL